MPRASAQIRLSPRGFNLIEAAIVLGVIGLVIGGIWIASAAVSDRVAANRTATGLVQAVSALRPYAVDFSRAWTGGYIYQRLVNTLGNVSPFPIGSWDGVTNNVLVGPRNEMIEIAVDNYSAPEWRLLVSFMNSPVSSCVAATIEMYKLRTTLNVVQIYFTDPSGTGIFDMPLGWSLNQVIAQANSTCVAGGGIVVTMRL